MLLREKIFRMNQKTYNSFKEATPQQITASFMTRKNSRPLRMVTTSKSRSRSPGGKRMASFSPPQKQMEGKIQILKEAISTLADSVEQELNLIQQGIIPQYEAKIRNMVNQAIESQNTKFEANITKF